MFTDTVGVAGSPADSVIIPRHYGSGFAMSDYKSNIHNIYLSAGFLPTSRLSITATATLNIADAAYEEVLFPAGTIEARLTNPTHPGGDLEHQDFTFDEMVSYSDLDYQLIRVGAGLTYRLAPRVTLSVDGEFADLTDDAGGYVYGDESGRFFMIRSGIGLEF